MLVSLLLNHAGQLIAGGLACDQLPMGNRYWREVLNVQGLDQTVVDDGCETAIVDLNDRELVAQILAYHLDPVSSQQRLIMDKLDLPLRSKHRVVVAKFAA